MRRSSDILNGAEWANVRALYKSSGFTGAELENPIIAVVTAFNEVCPGHIVLKQLTQRVKEGIYAAGGTPVEIGTIGACDGVAMSHKGMQYILPTREMIADDRICKFYRNHRYWIWKYDGRNWSANWFWCYTGTIDE